MELISILCPSRGRPGLALSMSASAVGTASGPVEVLLGVDADDPDLEGYRRDGFRVRGMDVVECDPDGTVSDIFNALAMGHSSGEILLVANDDQFFVTEGWDEAFRGVHRRHADGVYVAWCDDGINGEDHCAFPAVSRRWVDRLGYLAPTVGFRFFRNDTWIMDLGRRVGRLSYLPDVRVDHRHFSVGGVSDETTRRSRAGGAAGADRRLWAATEAVREVAAERLRGIMS